MSVGPIALVRILRLIARNDASSVAADAAEGVLASNCAMLLAAWCLASSTLLASSHMLSMKMGSRAIASRSEEHTSELQSLMRISYAVICLKKKKHKQTEQ